MSRDQQPPVQLPPPLMVSELGSFAHRTITVRLPAITRQAITDNTFPEFIADALESLASDLPFGRVQTISDDGGPDVAAWQSYVQPFLGQRWLDLPWFFAEAYFYRRLLEVTQYFGAGPWHGVDPFGLQK